MTDAFDLTSAVKGLAADAEKTRYSVVKDLAQMRGAEVIPLLMEAVGDASFRVRDEAIKGLCAFPGEAIFPRLETLLRDNENANLRTAAMEAFPRYGSRATPELLKLLTDCDEEIRTFAAVMLGEVKDRGSVDGLIAALADEDENVSHAAAESLGKIGDARAVWPLVECLAADFWTQYPAVIALGEIGDAAAAPALLALFNDEMLRQAVIEALGKIGDPAAVPALAEIIAQNDPSIRNEAIAALVNIQARAADPGQPGVPCLPSIRTALDQADLVLHLLECLRNPETEIRKNAIITLGWLKEKRAIPELCALLGDYDLGEYVIGSLAEIGEAALPEITAGLSNPDPRVRSVLVRSLRMMGIEAGAAACVPLLKDESADVRKQAVLAMRSSSAARLAEDELVNMLADPDPEVRGLVVEALVSLESPGLPAKLMDRLGAGGNATVSAVRALGRLKAEEAVPAIRGLLKHELDEVRAEACVALKEIAPSAVPRESHAAALQDPSPLVRRAAASCLGPDAGAWAADQLMAMIEEHDPEIRTAAIRALGRIRNPAAFSSLLEGFRSKDKPTRLAIISVMAGLDPASAVPFLTGLLKDTDPDVKQAALEAITAAGDERSAPGIMVALDDPEWKVRGAAIEALKAVGGRRCLARLVEKLDDPDDLIKKEAVMALADLGDREAVSSILPLIHNQNLELVVISALEKLGAPDMEFFFSFFNTMNTRLKGLLTGLLGRLRDPAAVAPLTGVLQREFFTVRGQAARALGMIGDRAAVPALLQAMREDPSDEVRKEATLALKRLNSAR